MSIHEMRRALGLSQKAVAAALSVSPSAVSHAENGRGDDALVQRIYDYLLAQGAVIDDVVERTCDRCGAQLTSKSPPGRRTCSDACSRALRREKYRQEYAAPGQRQPGRYSGPRCIECDIYLEAAVVVDGVEGADGRCAVCAGIWQPRTERRLPTAYDGGRPVVLAGRVR